MYKYKVNVLQTNLLWLYIATINVSMYCMWLVIRKMFSKWNNTLLNYLLFDISSIPPPLLFVPSLLWLVKWKWSINILFMMNLLEPNAQKQFYKKKWKRRKKTLFHKLTTDTKYHSLHIQFQTAKLYFSWKNNSPCSVC